MNKRLPTRMQIKRRKMLIWRTLGIFLGLALIITSVKSFPYVMGNNMPFSTDSSIGLLFGLIWAYGRHILWAIMLVGGFYHLIGRKNLLKIISLFEGR